MSRMTSLLPLLLTSAAAYPARIASSACRGWAPGQGGYMSSDTLVDGANGGNCAIAITGDQEANKDYTVTVSASTNSLFKLYTSDGQCLGEDSNPGLLAGSKAFTWRSPSSVVDTGISLHALCGSSYIDNLYAAAPVTLCPAGGCRVTTVTTTTAAGATKAVATSSNIELGEGAKMSFKPSGGDSVEITVSAPGSTWVGLGISKGDAVSMTGGGDGSDIVVCSDTDVRRHWVQGRNVPASGGAVVASATCTRENGRTTMVFTRKIAAETAMQRGITAGTSQQVIWAFGGEGQQAVQNHLTNRGGVFLDFASGSAEAAEAKGNAALYAHFICMIIAWGFLLPMGAAIANRTRNVPGAPKGAWFKLHLRLQLTGSLLQFLGLGGAIWFAQEYSTHFSTPHSFIGAIVCGIALLQVIGGALRPHVDPEAAKTSARKAFEVGHKGMGYLAVVLGPLNIFFGVIIVFQRGYEAAVKAVALGLALLCILPVIGFLLLALAKPNNKVSRWLTGAKGDASEVSPTKMGASDP